MVRQRAQHTAPLGEKNEETEEMEKRLDGAEGDVVAALLPNAASKVE